LAAKRRSGGRRYICRSTIILLPVYATFGERRPLLATSSSVLVKQGLVQGALQGLIGTMAQSNAIREPGWAVLFSATISALVIFLGIPVIGEKPSPVQIAGLGVVTGSLLVASGMWRMFRHQYYAGTGCWVGQRRYLGGQLHCLQITVGDLAKPDHAPRRRGQRCRNLVANHRDRI
jgi:hypothetical protein